MSDGDTKARCRTRVFAGPYVHIDAPNDTRVSTYQAGETDAALLQRIASSYGFQFFIDSTGFHWCKPRRAGAPNTIISYGKPDSTILQLAFTSSLARQVGRVEVRGRDPMQRKTIVARADAATPRDTLGATIEGVDPERYATAQQRDNAKAAIHPTGAATEEEAQCEANTRFIHAERASIEARASLVGTPHLVARQLVRLEGVTPYLTGNYYIEEATHSCNSAGYTTELHIMRDGGGPRTGLAVSPPGGTKNDKSPEKATGPMEVIDTDR